nr:hypothetical protein [uncultured Bacillus sp.]
MEYSDFSETIEISQKPASNKKIMQNVNTTYEQMLQDVRKMIKDNNEAAKLE